MRKINDEKVIALIERILKVCDEIIALIGGCKKCGGCCNSRTPILPGDKRKISKHLCISISTFEKKYLSDERPCFIKAPCPFLDRNNFCKIYQVRPIVCKMYPFQFLYLEGIGLFLVAIGQCPLATEVYKQFLLFAKKREEDKFIEEYTWKKVDFNAEYPYILKIPLTQLEEFLEELKT